MMNWERAFVLHTRAYSESSLIVDMLLEQSGRLSLLAKGARRKRSALKGILQPFTPLLVRYHGKSDLKTLLTAEAASLSLPLTGTGLFSGFYINEMLTRTLAFHQSVPELFCAYLHCLQELCINEQLEPALRRFEFILLESLGYQVDFLHCAYSGESVEKQMMYQYRERQGFVASSMKIQNQTFFEGETLLAFGTKDFSSPRVLRAAKRFTRLVMKPYLGGKPLKSRELFNASLLSSKNKSI